MPVLKNGRMTEGDILDMVPPYRVRSSTEGWIICQLADEVMTLRGSSRTGDDTLAAKTARLAERQPPVTDWFECEDGYPTDESIERLIKANLSRNDAARFLIEELPEIAKSIPYLSVEIQEGVDETFKNRKIFVVEFHTLGWSGAEDLIGAMLRNFFIESFSASWKRGGHYYFKVPADLVIPDTNAPGDLGNCPHCGTPLEPYGDNDLHDRWCDGCKTGFVAKDKLREWEEMQRPVPQRKDEG